MAMYGTEPVMQSAQQMQPGGGGGGSPLMRILASLAPQAAAQQQAEPGPDFAALARLRRGGMNHPMIEPPMQTGPQVPGFARGSAAPMVMGNGY